MADIGATFRSLVLADSTVLGLVGTRLFFDYLPQKQKLPAIVLWIPATRRIKKLDGVVSMSAAAVMVDTFAKSRTDSVTLCHAIRTAMEEQHRGDNSGVFINEISVTDDEAWSIDEPEAGSDIRRFVTSLEFLVHYRTS